ncbi:MAG: efflux RND transporter periplasmic adaptor subunit [Bryobacteraceae bacterium]
MNARVFALLLVLGCAACSKKAESEKADAPNEDAAVAPVETATARVGSIADIQEAEAVLYPLRQASILAKVTAPIQQLPVQRGDHVKAGQLLAVLENRDLTAAAHESGQLYRQAQATYENTRAAQMPDELTKAKADVTAGEEAYDAAKRVYESRLKLFKDGALAEKPVEDAKVAMVQAESTLATARQHLASFQSVGEAAQLRAAEAQVGAAEAHLNSAEAQLSYTRILSPMNGVVADRPLNVGELASGGSALLTIADISQVVARANVPINAASKMRVGQRGTVLAEGEELEGTVRVVSPLVDPNSTTVQVWVYAKNPEEKIKPGASARIRVDTRVIKDAILVPIAALLSGEDGGERVMIAGTDSLAHNRPVKVGVRSGDTVQITSGLKPGENVITSGALGLDDKAHISTEKEGPEKESAGKEQ